MTPLRKNCATCRVSKLLECFGESSQTPDGLRYVCRDCTKTYYRDWKARRVAAMTGWLREHGLKARPPGTRVARPSARAMIVEDLAEAVRDQ